MSDTNPSGLRGFLWGLAGTTAGAAVLNIFGWLFPSVDDFFAQSGKALGGLWAFLTSTWSVPAVPLVLGFVLTAVGAWRMVLEIRKLRVELFQRPVGGQRVVQRLIVPQSPMDSPLPPPPKARFNPAEQSILNQLLHAERNRKDVSEVVSNAGAIPQLIVEQAGTSLSEQGLVERRRNNGGYSWEYRLTDAGKALMTEAWKAKHS